jgi:hypothetical protein
LDRWIQRLFFSVKLTRFTKTDWYFGVYLSFRLGEAGVFCGENWVRVAPNKFIFQIRLLFKN